MTKFGEQADSKFRTLRHSKVFHAQLEELNKKYDAGGAVEILEWLICQNPYPFSEFGSGYLVAETVESINAPALWVLFLIVNDDLVHFCFIEEQTIEELDENL